MNICGVMKADSRQRNDLQYDPQILERESETGGIIPSSRRTARAAHLISIKRLELMTFKCRCHTKAAAAAAACSKTRRGAAVSSYRASRLSGEQEFRIQGGIMVTLLTIAVVVVI